MIREPEEQDRLHACALCRNDQEGAGTGRSHCRVSRKKIHARSPTAKKEKGRKKIEDLRRVPADMGHEQLAGETTEFINAKPEFPARVVVRPCVKSLSQSRLQTEDETICF
ncbi:UNVERIFIED_CONTAM: hypothetical protein K2H54_033684 [Gekko kuhli]